MSSWNHSTAGGREQTSDVACFISGPFENRTTGHNIARDKGPGCPHGTRGECMPDGEEIRAEVQTLKQDIGRLREDLGELLQSVRKEGDKRFEESKHKLREEAMNRIDKFKDVLDNARQYGQKACREARKRIERLPLATLLTVFGVGVIVGRMLMRRR